MTVRVYRSSDASAPTLTGAQGSLIALLDACLVNGYGTQVSSGWTKPFTTTNKAAFRMGGGNQRYLVIDETTNNGTATFFGFESMTAITSGTNQFPLTIQGSPLFFLKSSVTTATARNWIVIATDRFVHVISDYNTALNDFSSINHQYLGFGDIKSYSASDAYSTMIVGSPTNNNADTSIIVTAPGSNGTISGHFIARAYNQIGSSINVTKISDYSRNQQNYSTLGAFSNGGMPFPNPVDNKIWFSPLWICENSIQTGVIRGTYPGIWASLHSGGNFSTGDVITSISNLSGVTVEAVKGWASQSTAILFIETSNTW